MVCDRIEGELGIVLECSLSLTQLSKLLPSIMDAAEKRQEFGAVEHS